MVVRHASVGQILSFRRCPAGYYGTIQRSKTRQSTPSEAKGVATHKLASGEDVETTREIIDVKLAHLPQQVRDAVMDDAIELSETAVEMSAPEVTHERREVQLVWFDPVTQYFIYAKPDELFFFDEVEIKYGRRKVKSVMQITEIKSQAEEVRSYHYKQLFLFGLIATLTLRYHYSIKLVVRLVGPGIEEHKWFSQRETYRQLEELRTTLREMNDAWRTRTFEHRPGGYCKDCPLFAECEKGQQEMRRREEYFRSVEEDGAANGTTVPLRVLPATATQACA